VPIQEGKNMKKTVSVKSILVLATVILFIGILLGSADMVLLSIVFFVIAAVSAIRSRKKPVITDSDIHE